MRGVECAAVACEKRIQPNRFMCISDWRLVPPDLKDTLAIVKRGTAREDAELDAIESVQQAKAQLGL
jgi:hypothetical protein